MAATATAAAAAAALSSRTVLLYCSLFIFIFIILSPSPSHSVQISTIHDLLRSKGLPAGLLPREVSSYHLSDDGRLEVRLDQPCLTRFENRVYYERVVTANLTYGSLAGVVGLTQEELFLWLPVKDIIVDDPTSGLILFDIGVAHKQLSLSLFEDPPDCKPHDDQAEMLKNHVSKEKGIHEAMR